MNQEADVREEEIFENHEHLNDLIDDNM